MPIHSLRRSRPTLAALVTAATIPLLACAERSTPASPSFAIVRSEFLSERSPAPSVHASTIAEVDGRLVVAWFAGEFESASDVGIWVSVQDDSGWSQPVEVATGAQPDGGNFPTWNPVLHAAAADRLLLYYKVGPNPREWWGMVRTSRDRGRSWSDAQRLPDGILGPIKNKMVRLSDGTWVSPSSTEAPDSANAWRVHFERSVDSGASWTRAIPDAATAGGSSPNDSIARVFDAIQPTILVHRDGRLQALARTRGPGRIAETWSVDGGLHWSALTLTDLPNPNSGIDAVTLRDGRHLLAYNPVAEGRTPLAIAMSTDGRTWTPVLTVESDSGEYSYPAVIEASDSTVHLVYTWRRQKIKHVIMRPITKGE